MPPFFIGWLQAGGRGLTGPYISIVAEELRSLAAGERDSAQIEGDSRVDFGDNNLSKNNPKH